jgi:hypothetical protein
VKIVDRVIKSRRMSWTGHVSLTGEKRKTCKISIGKCEWNRLHGRPRLRREYNIKMKLRDEE